MMWRGLVIASMFLAALASCGDTVALSSVDAGADASADAEPNDAGASLYDGPCDPNKPFGTPVEGPFAPLDAVPNITQASLSDDELVIVFVRNERFTHSTTLDLHSASRASLDAAFAGAASFPYNTSGSDPAISGYPATFAPVLTPDGLTLYFNGGGATVGTKAGVVMKSVRSDRSSAWQPPIATTLQMAPVAWFAGELWLLGDHTYRAAEVDGGLGDLQVIPELDGLRSVVLADSGRRVFVMKTWNDVNPDRKVYTAVRKDTTTPFGPFEEVPELEAPYDPDAGYYGWGSPVWASTDGCRVALAGYRPDLPPKPSGSWYDGTNSRLFVATRPR